jgi:hypothetical protein
VTGIAKAIGLVATAIGVVTGLGTIVGTLVSDKTVGVVARTAIGCAGMAAWAAFALACVVVALLPPQRLRRFLAGSKSPLFRRPIVARPTYLALALGVVPLAQDEGLDPTSGFWLASGAFILGVALVTWATVAREQRRGEVRECPDCAETVKAKARVCRYCGYRFAPPPPVTDPLADYVDSA